MKLNDAANIVEATEPKTLLHHISNLIISNLYKVTTDFTESSGLRPGLSSVWHGESNFILVTNKELL